MSLRGAAAMFSRWIAPALTLFVVLFVLVALLLPASQSARESSRTTASSPKLAYRTSADAAPMPSAPMPAGGVDQVPPATAAAPPTTPRKIIYTGDVDLVVEDFPKAAESVTALVARFGGYVADTDISGSTGVNRRATWKARVPIERFDAFLDAVVKLGELQRRQVHSQDVTEEFYDLTARIKNKKVEEGRLVKHLEESTGKLKEILDVEREISRVREEVERMEGRIRLLANLADLTTVTVVVNERVGYVPPTAPGFATRAARTFGGSAERMTEFLQGLVLLAISVVPWIPVWIVTALLAWILLRRLRRRAPASPPLAQERRPA